MSSGLFIPRLSIPETADLNWIKTTYGGYNPCVLGSPSYTTGSVLANCVGYSWGRWRELLGYSHNLSTGNAQNWYGHTTDGYTRGSVPKLGAIACWSGGTSGHVANVEKISSTAITCSESGYGSYYFRTTDYDLNMTKSGYTFQGFIYLPIDLLTIEELASLKRRRKHKYKKVVIE